MIEFRQTATRAADTVTRRAALVAAYPDIWRNITTEWQQPDPEDRAWLTYSANYILRTGGVRWAIDPLTLHWRMNDAQVVDAAALAGASFILLTHRHADHLDLDLLAALAAYPICWVVPEALHDLAHRAGLRRERILTPVLGQSLKFNGVRVTPFDGLHWEPRSEGGLRGVPAMGYLVEFTGWNGHARRWLFPGDTRSYDAARLPGFGALDGVFAHVWLGRGAALADPPPLLDSFCRFCLALKPKRIILAHLDEFGRDDCELWAAHHLPALQAHFELLGMRNVEAVFTGENVEV